MLSFFKTFFRGILYVILLPIFVAILAFYLVYCVIVFIYHGLRAIFVFFAGGTPFGDLPEDVKAKEILLRQKQGLFINPIPSYEQPAINQPINVAPIYQEPTQMDIEPQIDEVNIEQPISLYNQNIEQNIEQQFEDLKDETTISDNNDCLLEKPSILNEDLEFKKGDDER